MARACYFHSELCCRGVPRPKASDRPDHVGQQIRQLPHCATLAAGALARSTGAYRSMLSRIESGLVSPSIETLRKLATGLGVPMSRLFSERADRTSRCHVPAGIRLKVELGEAMAGHCHELLGHLVSTLRRIDVEPAADLDRTEEQWQSFAGMEAVGHECFSTAWRWHCVGA